MSRYIIPNYKLDDLEKKISKIRNKGADIVFDIINNNVQMPISSESDITIACSEVEVSGEYKINGWSFVGTIEHASPENIIRLADTSFEDRIPERYRTADRECEHCHIRRDRKDTYLVYNEETDEFKQVGRTCLQGYTRGLNAETCAEMVSVFRELARINSDVENENLDIDLDDYRIRSYTSYPMKIAKKKAYKYVEEKGYTSGETGRNFDLALHKDRDMREASDSEINEVENWLKGIRESGWQRNALAAWTKDNYESRDASLITSAVSFYLRDKQKNQARMYNRAERGIGLEFAGDVGDKVTLTISDIKVAYERSGVIAGNNYYSYPVYRIIGTDNNIYLWGCTNEDIELKSGDILKGTVKRQIVRPNGEKQTEITRCKIIGNAPKYRGFFNEALQPPNRLDLKYNVPSVLDKLRDLIKKEVNGTIPSFNDVYFELDYYQDNKDVFIVDLIDEYSRYNYDKYELELDLNRIKDAIRSIGGNNIVIIKKLWRVRFKFNTSELEKDIENIKADVESRFNNDFNTYTSNINSIDISKYKPSEKEFIKLNDYKSRNSNVNVRAIKETDKLLRYLYGAVYIDYPKLVNQIESELIDRNIINIGSTNHNDMNNVVTAIKNKAKRKPFGF